MIESCRLHYNEKGNSNDNIVIVHGLFGSSDNWVTIGRRLSENHHVYMVDQRNHGHSPHCKPHSYETMKEDLVRFFNDHMINKATLIGHSMGGKTVMAFAADYPELVDKLIVVDIAPKNYMLIGEKKQHQLIIQALKGLRNDYTSRQEIAAFINNRINDLDVTLFILKSFYRNKKTGKFDCRLNLDALDESLDSIVGDVDAGWFAGKQPANYPVLFIRSEKSGYISDNDIPVIRKIYPDAVIETISGAGHWLHAEQPEQFLKVLKNFIL